MIRKNLYQFSFLFQAVRKKKLNPLIDQLFSQEQLKKYLDNTLNNQSPSEIDHKRVVLSFMQIIGREWVPKSFVILMSSYVNKYNLSQLLNGSLITERILAREKEITHILPELFLMLSQSKLPKDDLMAFQSTILAVLPQDLSSMNVEFLIGLLTQTLACRTSLKPLVVKLCIALEGKVWKFDKYDILDFIEIYKYGKAVAKPELTQLLNAFELRLIEAIHMFNSKEFVQMIQGLRFGKDLNEQLLRVLEKKALVEANNFPMKDIFTVLDFFRTFIRIDQNKLILQLLLEFGKQKLCKVIRKLDNSILVSFNNDLLLQDLLTLSILSYESSFLSIYSLLPMEITEEAKGNLSDPLIEKRVLEQLRKATSSSCMSYLFISLEAQLLNVEIMGIIEEKIISDQTFTSLHLEAFYKMANSKYLPDLEKWSSLIENFIENNKNQFSSEDMYYSLMSCIILILEKKTKFEETYLSLTKLLLEKKTRFNIFQKLDLLRYSCFVPNIFTWPVANFLLEEISQAALTETRLFEFEDRFAKLILSLEALFSKDKMNPIIIKGYNYDSRRNQPNVLHLNLPENLISIWKKSEAIYRANLIKRKPLYQVSLLEDNVLNALIGFLKNKGLVLSGGHYVYGFEVDIAIILDKKIVLVEVNGKSHYYLNKKEDQTWRTKGKENFFNGTDVVYFTIGMKEWNNFRFKKREFINFMFKKKKLLSDFMLDRNENEEKEKNIN